MVSRVAISAAIKGIVTLGRVFLLNPIGLAITAIAVGAFLIIKYWKPIKAFFINLWESISTGAMKVWEKLKKVIEPIVKVKKMVGSAWDSLFGENKESEETSTGTNVLKNNVVDISKNVDPLTNKAKAAIANDNSAKNTITNNITVNPSQGMDEKAVAREVQRAIEEKERQMQNRKRAVNYD